MSMCYLCCLSDLGYIYVLEEVLFQSSLDALSLKYICPEGRFGWPKVEGARMRPLTVIDLDVLHD